MQNIIFVLLFISLTLVHAEDDDKCFKLRHSIRKGCCKFNKKPDESLKELWIKCVKESSGKPCEKETCFAKNRGILTDDGTIDNDKFIADVEKHVDDKETLQAIKDKCIDKDLAAYGPPDMCLIAKTIHCTILTSLSNCPEWSDKDSCKEMKTTIEECSKLVT